MSITIPGEKRAWLPLAAGLSLLIAGIWGMLVLPRRPIPGAHEPTGVESSVTDPSIPQARWKETVFPAGVIGRASKQEKAIVQRERPEVVTAVRDVYNSLLLAPDQLKKLSGTALAPAAADALASSRLVLPKGMDRVRTTKRIAKIGIDADGGSRAAATVSIWYSGRLKNETVRVVQHSTLWLEGDGKHWLVIAFDGTQGQI